MGVEGGASVSLTEEEGERLPAAVSGIKAYGSSLSPHVDVCCADRLGLIRRFSQVIASFNYTIRKGVFVSKETQAGLMLYSSFDLLLVRETAPTGEPSERRSSTPRQKEEEELAPSVDDHREAAAQREGLVVNQEEEQYRLMQSLRRSVSNDDFCDPLPLRSSPVLPSSVPPLPVSPSSKVKASSFPNIDVVAERPPTEDRSICVERQPSGNGNTLSMPSPLQVPPDTSSSSSCSSSAQLTGQSTCARASVTTADSSAMLSPVCSPLSSYASVHMQTAFPCCTASQLKEDVHDVSAQGRRPRPSIRALADFAASGSAHDLSSASAASSTSHNSQPLPPPPPAVEVLPPCSQFRPDQTLVQFLYELQEVVDENQPLSVGADFASGNAKRGDFRDRRSRKKERADQKCVVFHAGRSSTVNASALNRRADTDLLSLQTLHDARPITDSSFCAVPADHSFSPTSCDMPRNSSSPSSPHYPIGSSGSVSVLSGDSTTSFLTACHNSSRRNGTELFSPVKQRCLKLRIVALDSVGVLSQLCRTINRFGLYISGAKVESTDDGLFRNEFTLQLTNLFSRLLLVSNQSQSDHLKEAFNSLEGFALSSTT